MGAEPEDRMRQGKNAPGWYWLLPFFAAVALVIALLARDAMLLVSPD